MAKKKRKASHPPERGLGLSIWLILVVIHGFVAGFATLSLMKEPEGLTRDWLVIGLLLFTSAKVIAALGIWNWKKWGLYTYVVGVLGTMIIALFLTGFLILGVFYEAIPLLITGWLLRGKTDYFK